MSQPDRLNQYGRRFYQPETQTVWICSLDLCDGTGLFIRSGLDAPKGLSQPWIDSSTRLSFNTLMALNG